MSISESHRYKPDVNNDTSILMTDVTSISMIQFSNKSLIIGTNIKKIINSLAKETIDGEICMFPFELNGIQNNFCAIDEDIEDNDVLQCQTTAGLSNCTLGIFFI